MKLFIECFPYPCLAVYGQYESSVNFESVNCYSFDLNLQVLLISLIPVFWFNHTQMLLLSVKTASLKRPVWWNDTTTDDICTYFNDEFIVILSNIIFTNCACDSCKVGDYPVGLTADPANLTVESRGRTEYRTAVLTARPIETTCHR